MNKKWDIDSVIEYINANSESILLSNEYESYTKPLLFKCHCGIEFSVSFATFKGKKKTTCTNCSRIRTARTQSKTNDDFVLEVKHMVNDEYTFLEQYKGARNKIKVRHNNCGYEYEITPDGFLSKGRRCPLCNGGIAKDEESFKEEIRVKFKNEYELIGKYQGARRNVTLLHKKCGHTFEVMTTNFLGEKSACHKCNGSLGEKKIIGFLDQNNVYYKQEYSFSDLKRHHFDFVIFDKDKIIAIEYDGIQHFKPVKYFGGKDKLKIQVKRDEVKNNYCKLKNIKLIRIPYWKFDDIEEILKDAIR